MSSLDLKSFDIFYFDFDRTLFHSDDLYDDFKKICLVSGISSHSHDDALKEFLSHSDRFNYFKAISRSLAVDDDTKVVDLLKEHLSNNGAKYIFDDALAVLSCLKTTKSLKLITYGDLEFQSAKISASKISDFFDEVIITENSKWLHPSLRKDKEFVLIDDNPREIENIKKMYKESAVIRITRSSTKYYNKHSSSEDMRILELSELQALLAQ